MLYRINLPNCTQHLNWVVQLQSDLLHALCDPNLNAGTVTADWVKNQRQDINPRWIERFCRRRKDHKSILDRMKDIAGLSPLAKRAIIRHYDNNLRYLEAFSTTSQSPPTTRSVPENWAKSTSSKYYDFFEMFYEIGYMINASDGELFSIKNYLEAYRLSNSELRVCPLCDGSMDDPEFDHWLARNYLPELNCHPQNLVEVCGACNGPRNKHGKVTFDDGQTNPFAKWFHPHLRPAIGNYRVEKQSSGIKLVSNDLTTQERLDKLDQLLNLSTRWAPKWQIKMKRVEFKLRTAISKKHALDENQLMQMLQDWMDEAVEFYGRDAHALLEKWVLCSALDQNSNEYEEIRIYAEECRQQLSE